MARMAFGLSLLWFWFSAVVSLPVERLPGQEDDSTSLVRDDESPSLIWEGSSRLNRRQEKQLLRIMPLGASNTAGVGSNPEDGYRKPLRDALRFAGFPVNMVGSQSNADGGMKNGAHEGYPGKRISEIGDLMKENGYLDRKPNVVLIHAGTNNCLQDNDWQIGYQQLEDITNYIFEQIDRVVVIMSTLPPLLFDDEANSRCQATLNPGIRDKVIEMQADGKPVYLASIGDGGYITDSDIGDDDGVHFTEEGYAKVATVWYDVIQQIYANGDLPLAEETDYPDKDESDDTCEKIAGNGYGPVETQFGVAGDDDGVYAHASEDTGLLEFHGGNSDAFLVGSSADTPEDIFFAQLVRTNPDDHDRNHIRDDLIQYSRHETSDKLVARVWVNNYADGTFDLDPVKFDVDDGDGCLTRGVRWGDVNNDGLDDYICIGAEGNMYVSINKGGNPPTFESVGTYFTVPDGYSQDNVLLADVDGDGRIDYCVTADNGDIRCWRNGGVGDKPGFWQDLGVVFTGKGMGDIRGTRFVNINGDHRSDWVWMYPDTGKTRIFTNSRGRFFGLAPLWKEASASHVGTGESNAWNRVKFGRIFDRQGYGSDYIQVSSAKSAAAGGYAFTFRVYQNNGEGGTTSQADGNRYCDMTNKGRDDLLYVSPDGRVQLWSNENTNGYKSSPWTWGSPTNIFLFASDSGFEDRRGVHLADVDGDGKCDIIYHDEVSGVADWWRNDYDTDDDTWSFTSQGGFTRCTTPEGFGIFDLEVRFADIDGDGRADILCMELDGRTTGFLNTEDQTVLLGQIKKSEGHDRANHRWADVNGDGLSDFLWMDNMNGDTYVWENEGEVEEPVDGSKFRWTSKGKLYQGQSRGANQYFPDLDGNGRADLVHINPDTNTGVTWFNICPNGGSGQDDPDSEDPHIPGLPTCPVAFCDFGEGCDDPPFVWPPPPSSETKRDVEKRAGKGDYGGNSRNFQVGGLSINFHIISLLYPTLQAFLGSSPAGRAHTLYLAPFLQCDDTAVEESNADDANGTLRNPLPPEWQTTQVQIDHPFDLQTMSLFLEFAVSGRMTGTGRQTNLPTISQSAVESTWNSQTGIPSPPGSPPVPPGRSFQVINDFIMDAYGSFVNVDNLVPLQADINNMKSRIFGGLVPYDIDSLRTIVRRGRGGSQNDYNHVERTLQAFFATFSYLNRPNFGTSLDQTLDLLRERFEYIERNNAQWQGVLDLWDEWVGEFFQVVVDVSNNWAEGAMNMIIEEVQGDNSAGAQALLRLITLFFDQLGDIRIDGRADPS